MSTEPLGLLRVKCHFCHEIVLAMVCDKVIDRRVLNTQPEIVKERIVYRCDDCKKKGCGK